MAAEPSRRRSRIDGRDVVPLLLMAIMTLVLVIWAPAEAHRGDVLRFYEIAHGGTPYVDQQVEYPPLETAVIMAVGASSVDGTAIVLAIVNAVATVGCWWLLRSAWSEQVGRLFLWFAVPLQVFMPFRLDMVSVLLVVAGIVLVRRRREVAGGALMGAAVLFKLWPVVVLPMLLLRRQGRALAAAIATVVVGVITWLAIFGGDALWQVASYRGAKGWQIESVPGAILRLTTSDGLKLEAGATRIGEAPSGAFWASRVLTVAFVVLAWVLARRRRVDLAGGPVLASVTTALLLSPVASPQYVAWFLPAAAIVASEREEWDVRIATVVAAATASAVFWVYWYRPLSVILLAWLALARAIAIAVLAVIGFTHSEVTRVDDAEDLRLAAAVA